MILASNVTLRLAQTITLLEVSEFIPNELLSHKQNMNFRGTKKKRQNENISTYTKCKKEIFMNIHIKHSVQNRLLDLVFPDVLLKILFHDYVKFAKLN